MKNNWIRKTGLLLTSLALLAPTVTTAHAETINDDKSVHINKENVKTLKTEPVDFETRIIKDKDLPSSVKIVAQKGKKGTKTFYQSTDTTIDSNGNAVSLPVYYEEITQLPQEEVIRQGTNKEVIEGVSDKTKKLEEEKAEKLKEEKQRKAKEKEEREQAESSSSEDSTSSDSTNNNDNNSFVPPTSVDRQPEYRKNVDSSAPAGHVTTPAENKAYARSVLSPEEFVYANKLIMRESEWKTTADNPYSSAYGVPQALPGSKMASAGADWRTNGKTQFKWMQGYVKERYGSWKNALAHSYNHGWY